MSMYNAPGRYTVKVTAMQFGETENGKPGLFFTIEPLTFHGPEGDVQAENTPRTIAYYFSTPENAAISLEQLRRLGWEGTSFKDLYEGTWSLVDQELLARCKEDNWTDKETGEEKTSEKWSFLTGPGGMKVTGTAPKPVKDLDTRFGHLLKNSTNGTPPTKPTSTGASRRSSTPF